MRQPRRVREYEVTVHPDGSWNVQYLSGYDCFASRRSVAEGNAEDQRRGEVAARCAIEDDKAARAKDQVKASMIQRFTVKA